MSEQTMRPLPRQPSSRDRAAVGWLAVALAAAALLLVRPGGATTAPPAPRPTEVPRLSRVAAWAAPGSTTALAFSPAGTELAAVASNGTVRRWGADGSARPPLTPDGEAASLTSARLAFGPSGSLLASSQGDETVWIWDFVEGRRLRAIRHDAAVESLALAPRGDVLAIGGADGVVRLWDPTLGRGLRTLLVPTGARPAPIRSLAFSDDGRFLGSGDWEGTVRLWELPRGRLVLTLESADAALALAFAPDRDVVAVGGFGGATLFDLTSGRRLATLPHEPTVQSLAWSREDGSLVTFGGGVVRRWGEDGRALGAWEGAEPNALAILAPGQRLAATASLGRGEPVVEIWRW